MTAVLFPVVGVYVYFLGAYAVITQWLWSRYPERVRHWADCPACSGFWYGLGLAFLGRWRGWSFLGLDLDWDTVFLCAAWVAAWVPVLHRVFLSQLVAGRRELDAERYAPEPAPDDGDDGVP